MGNAKIAHMEHLPILQREPVYHVLPHALIASAVPIVQDVILAIIFMHINAYQMSPYVKLTDTMQ